MDFVPEPSTASYECYVSESDTEGEGASSLGQRRRPISGPVYPAAPPAFHSTGAGSGSLLGKKGDASVSRRNSSGEASSILSRLAASWKTTTTAVSSAGVRGGGPSIEELHRYQLHREGGEVTGTIGDPRKDDRECLPSSRGKVPAATATALDILGHGDRRPTNRCGQLKSI